MFKREKTYLLLIVLLFFSVSLFAQIDSRKKNVAIPAVENEKDSLDASPTKPATAIKSKGDFKGLTIPKTNTNLGKMPKKELSMFSEEFGNPGELYTDRLKKTSKYY